MYANQELVDASAGQTWSGKVFAVDGSNLEIVENITSEALKAGKSFTDKTRFPVGAIFSSLGDSLQDYRKGKIALRDLPADAAVRVALDGTLAFIGL